MRVLYVRIKEPLDYCTLVYVNALASFQFVNLLNKSIIANIDYFSNLLQKKEKFLDSTVFLCVIPHNCLLG